jgi:hypothetical protein
MTVRIMIFQVCDTAWFLGYLQTFRRYLLPISEERFKNKGYNVEVKSPPLIVTFQNIMYPFALQHLRSVFVH